MADAAVLLRPFRTRILEMLAEPQSAAGIARRLDVARQKVGYHLKELEKQGLVELVEEKKVGNCVERIVRATGGAYLVSAEAPRTRKDPPALNKNPRDIELSVELDASPEDVFRAVTDGTEIAKWLAPEARVTAPEGGKKGSIWISWGEGMSAEHEIEIFEAPKRIRHPSGQNGETKAPLYADWSIEAREGGKTTLRLVHSGFSASADWDDEYEAHKRGWTLMLQNLRQYFARHAHEPAEVLEHQRPAALVRLLLRSEEH